PDGQPSRLMTRYVFERGDAAAVIVHDAKCENVVLVRQFRIPPICRTEDGWMLEIVAGSMSPDDDPREVVLRELLEEAGIDGVDPTAMGSFYLSPGASSERCHLFHAESDLTGLHGRTGGEKGTHERTWVLVYSLDEALRMVDQGRIIDAKTVIALQMVHRKRLIGDAHGITADS
ncbi:NUDIX hydrolase, partial [bacterium]|nr:NUDIX hydrolase [candidate division CSSED10-310 bacterium]